MNSRLPLTSLDGRRFDVVIIGGGINGAAGAQQLAARGFQVLLADKGDFGSGSSSRSSRLLHCGLRYLAPGGSAWDFLLHPSRLATGMRMARLAIEARHEFVNTTAARAQLSKLYFPIYKGGAYSGWQVDLAFRMLDHYNRGRIPLNYQRLSGPRAASIPLVNALRDFDTLDSVASYDEFQISWPERVTVDIALDARRMGATVLNYTEAELVGRRGDGWEVALHDAIDGTRVRVQAEAVVNTAGIWIDKVLGPHRAGKPPKVLGTKGSHIAVELAPECRGIGVATINRKNEPFYCLPWGRYHYIGPTELIYEGDLDKIRTSTQDRDWLLAEANHLFPSFNLTARDVAHTWSGVRPLTWDARLPKGNRSRVLHDLSVDGLDKVFAMTGGPVMTHRSAGVEIADAVAARVRRTGKATVADFRSDFPSPQEADVLPALRGDRPPPPWLDAMLEHGMVVHLSDALMRRAGVPWYHPLQDTDIERIGRYLGGRLGWAPARTEQEIAAFKQELSVLQHAV
ncbi:Glycerol-3-phosphate dehydrogenase [Bordetella sputigena]|uniref:FAD-dependent oxidoreductase n=1 Tax=Bordetella sputigena TaxID=1416810 RepID=UPI0039EF0197